MRRWLSPQDRRNAPRDQHIGASSAPLRHVWLTAIRRSICLNQFRRTMNDNGPAGGRLASAADCVWRGHITDPQPRSARHISDRYTHCSRRFAVCSRVTLREILLFTECDNSMTTRADSWSVMSKDVRYNVLTSYQTSKLSFFGFLLRHLLSK